MKRGFTLIEILVSVAIFSVVMVIALGALLSMSVADRKAETLKSTINNLNFALDSMSRAIRTGYNYGCPTTAGLDCKNGANEMVFTASSGQTTYYKLDTTSADCGQPSGTVGGCIARSYSGSAGSWSPVTSPEVVITDYSTKSPASYLFYVLGSAPSPGDTVQPKVIMTLTGTVQVSATQSTALHLETSVAQRLYDQ